MSKTYNLSVVNIASEQYKDVINAIGEAYGVGPNSLSVKLQDANGAIYWGCHSWWKPSDYDFFSKAPPPSDISNAVEALAALYERVVLDGVPMENWNTALAELGLSVVEEPL